MYTLSYDHQRMRVKSTRQILRIVRIEMFTLLLHTKWLSFAVIGLKQQHV